MRAEIQRNAEMKQKKSAVKKSTAKNSTARKGTSGNNTAKKPAVKKSAVQKPAGARVPDRSGALRNRKREWMAGAGLFACLIGLLMRIPLGRIIGDEGIGFFSSAMEIVAVFSVILLYGTSRSVAILVRYRVKRQMYKSARRVFKTALFLSILTGALAAAGVFFFSEAIGTAGILEHMSYLAIAAASPAILLLAVTGVYRGYFQGMGTMVPAVHSRLLVKLLTLAGGLLFGFLMYGYGEKVAALLKDEAYASAYGAMGAALGLTAACLFGVLHLLFIHMIYAGTLRQQLYDDSSKYVENGGQIAAMLISTALPYIFCALLYNINFLVDQRIFNYAVNVKSGGTGRAMYWGVYYGKYASLAGAAAVLCTLAGNRAIPRIVQAFERQEYREAQVRLERIVHHIAVVAIPSAVLLAVLAEPVAGILFQGEVETAVRLLQAGSALVVLFPLTWLFMGILQRLRKMKTVLIGGLGAFAVHLAVLLILIFAANMGIMAVMCGLLSFYLTAAAIGFLGVRKYMKYSQEWIRTFGVTAAAAGVAGLIGTLLEKALLSLAGYVVTLAVCLLIYVIAYHVLLLLLRGVNRDDVEAMPGGRLIVAAAEKLHLL